MDLATEHGSLYPPLQLKPQGQSRLALKRCCLSHPKGKKHKRPLLPAKSPRCLPKTACWGGVGRENETLRCPQRHSRTLVERRPKETKRNRQKPKETEGDRRRPKETEGIRRKPRPIFYICGLDHLGTVRSNAESQATLQADDGDQRSDIDGNKMWLTWWAQEAG